MNDVDLQEHIDEVMDHFNFEVVLKMMDIGDIFWIRGVSEEERPTSLKRYVRKSIKDAFMRYKDSLIYEGTWYMESGGTI